MMLAVDTNLLIYSADVGSPHCGKAREFLQDHTANPDFVLCELNLIELYMALRNPAVFRKPLDARGAYHYCEGLRSNDAWQIIDYVPEVGRALCHWALSTRSNFHKIIDARMAYTLLHHGVTHFATANVKDFKEFDFESVYNPLQ